MNKLRQPQNAPEEVQLKAGKKYFWCACGLSDQKTFCDGSHKSTEVLPMAFESPEDKSAWICCCKKTGNPPYCDGSHNVK